MAIFSTPLLSNSFGQTASFDVEFARKFCRVVNGLAVRLAHCVVDKRIARTVQRGNCNVAAVEFVAIISTA